MNKAEKSSQKEGIFTLSILKDARINNVDKSLNTASFSHRFCSNKIPTHFHVATLLESDLAFSKHRFLYKINTMKNKLQRFPRAD